MKPLDAAARASRPEFDVHLTKNVMVPMRDRYRRDYTGTTQRDHLMQEN